MRYRLPLELELTILEFAAPPLAIDRLHDRVDFFINAALVHRSFTAWAQDRLHDQFLYTYRPRPDADARLERRLTEGGYGASCPIQRLYLDVARLRPPGDPEPDSWNEEETRGPARAAETPAVASEGSPSSEGQDDQTIDGHGIFEVDVDAPDVRWTLSPLLARCVQALDTMWLKLPHAGLNIKSLPPPRVLHIDDGAMDGLWGEFELLPVSFGTTLYLRNVDLAPEQAPGRYNTRHIILHDCSATEASLSTVLDRFPQLETVVFFEPEIDDLASVLLALPTPIRRVHILEHSFRMSTNTPLVLPRLESFTYTFLSSRRAPRMPADDQPDADALAEVQQAIESIVDAPKCTFKYLRSTISPEGALADALAALELDL